MIPACHCLRYISILEIGRFLHLFSLPTSPLKLFGDWVLLTIYINSAYLHFMLNKYMQKNRWNFPSAASPRETKQINVDWGRPKQTKADQDRPEQTNANQTDQSRQRQTKADQGRTRQTKADQFSSSQASRGIKTYINRWKQITKIETEKPR